MYCSRDWTSSLGHQRHEVIDVSSSDSEDDKVCKIDAMNVEEGDHLQRKYKKTTMVKLVAEVATCKDLV